MADLPNSKIFLKRSGYRQRRIRDAAKLLPVVGLFILLVPLFEGREAQTSSSDVLIYLFTAWGILAGLAGLLSLWLKSDVPAPEEKTGDPIGSGQIGAGRAP